MEWLEGLLPREFLPRFSPGRRSPLCLTCRGRGFCGRVSCPLLLRAQSLIRVSRLVNSNLIQGSSPPAVFVGRIGYPKVWVGPMVPPVSGDTTIMDSPELWLEQSLESLIQHRCLLVRGRRRSEVTGMDRSIRGLQELAMSAGPVEAEMVLEKVPRVSLSLSEDAQPFGPSAPLRSLRLNVPRVDPRLEKAHNDTDLPASEAVCWLYRRGVPVSAIQRSFSLGTFGVGRRRRLVPTRWSITAVDSLISEHLVERVKQLPIVEEYRVYKFRHLENRFVVVLFPHCWSFEWVEAWYPGTVWNQNPLPELISDWEGYWGRKSYPDIGGCYYACRLAVAEALEREGRQAAVLAMREIHPGFLMPLGVWLVRECIRRTMRQEPEKFSSLEEALDSALSFFELPKRAWLEQSRLLQELTRQLKLSSFL
ncbi:MAG: Nre family DNA repair protein [Candidatus Hadarchaeales archaeon]